MRNWLKAFIPLVALTVAAARADEVRLYEEPFTLPTYRIGEPEQMPCWDRLIYPYTLYDRITDEKYDRTYRALYIENEFIKVLILPEIGGRLHGALDKTGGGYQFLFDQRTIKPALVGMAGAWISGGIEWNFPHGHRPSGYRPADWRLVENPDGSKTVWTGEIERVFGMRWAVGNTLYPGRTWIETRVRLFNCTPYPQSFQYWADCAVRGSEKFQAVIPGEIATSHGKHQFFRWPVNDGADLRLWKNAPGGTSYFVCNSESDYYGSYTPEDDGGMAHWADHHIVRGKKLWFCGTSPAGRLWEKVLTNGDAPLVEPQAGAYSDNQPDYHWIMPGETKVFSHFWFPVRHIGIWDYANLEGAVALKMENRKVKAGWSPTGRNAGARVVLSAAGAEFFSRRLDADPAAPFLAEAKSPAGVDLYSLRMTVLSASGGTLLSFQHPRPVNPSLPEPEPPYPAPGKVESQEKLFLIGDHLELFRDPRRALEYYLEALRRDPGDLRSNTAAGLVCLRQGAYTQALEYLEQALERDPGCSKAWYCRGLAGLGLGDLYQAERDLNRAGYDLAYYAAAQLELARLSARRADWPGALGHIERAIRGNGDNSESYAVRAVILNHLGQSGPALESALAAQAADPLDFLSLAERAAALKGLGREPEAAAVRDTLLAVTRLDENNHLELAVRYARCGLYAEAAAALEAVTGRPSEEPVSPLVYYYLAWYYHQLGQAGRAADALAKAAEVSDRYCFPSRLETFPVLAWALGQNPADARAHYLLGTLLYSCQRENEAIEALEKSVALNPGNAIAQRNLGYAWMMKNDLQKARSAYEAAVRADPQAAAALVELDEVYQKLGLSAAERAGFLESHLKTTSSSDPALKRLVSCYVESGRYDDAIATLKGHRFHSWEGGFEIHLYWVESQLRLGDREFEQGNYAAALELYTLALTYPDNLEVKEQPNTVHARENYKVGEALEALGRKKEARVYFELVVTDSLRADEARCYYQGKAFAKLGRPQAARRVFERMLAALDTPSVAESPALSGAPTPDKDFSCNAQALVLYKRSLALEGLGKSAEAEATRREAVGLDPLVGLRAFSPPRAGW